VKKNNQNLDLSDSNLNFKKNFIANQIKTTNINILLNRVKIEKKNNLKKKIYLSLLMFLFIGFFSAFVISI
jgi:CRISPR/Cas system CSM-associated protein Csm2 small subunit